MSQNRKQKTKVRAEKHSTPIRNGRAESAERGGTNQRPKTSTGPRKVSNPNQSRG
jgi:hypothetical protein